MTEYKTWITASKAVATLRLAVHREEDASPAWNKLRRIGEYLNAQAETAMNGGE